MNYFEFNSPTKIYFGKDVELKVGEVIKEKGYYPAQPQRLRYDDLRPSTSRRSLRRVRLRMLSIGFMLIYFAKNDQRRT